MFAVSPEVEEKYRHLGVVEDELAMVAGVTNASYGRLVEILGEALDDDLWQGWGIHSPGHWLAWKTGVTQARADHLVRIARRRGELPCAVAALVAGELSVDQTYQIALHVPAAFDRSVTEFTKAATVAQLRKVLPRYQWTDDVEEPAPTEERRALSLSYGEDGQGRIGASLPMDEAAVVETALRAAREHLYEEAVADLPADEPRPQIGLAEALVSLAESYLSHGQAAHPSSDRYIIHAHLEAAIGGDGNLLSLHLGPVLPRHLRRLHTCDATIRPVWETHGTPVDVGRDQRIVPRRVRRLIEHRDGGCAVPGCGRTHGLEVHHIIHWEDGGVTDTHNLLTLCRSHHRAHHHGLLGIDGNPDGPDGATFTDRFGRTLASTGKPVIRRPDEPLVATAVARGMTPHRYQHPTGERLQTKWVQFSPSAPPVAGEPAPPPRSWSPAAVVSPPPTPEHSPFPTRAGPSAEAA